MVLIGLGYYTLNPTLVNSTIASTVQGKEPGIKASYAFAIPSDFNTPLDENVKVHVIDVGQGDSILVQTGKENILVDAGNTGNGKMIWDYLQKQGVEHVKYLVGTHEDADHIGSIDEVIEEGLTFDYYVSPFQPCDTKACRDVDALTQTKRLEVKRGDQLNAHIPILVLNPIRPLEFENKNDNAVVLTVLAGNIRILLTGDCEKKCEDSMRNAGVPLNAQVLKVGHHGSKTSSSTEFLNEVQSEIGIISVGADNTYGHPHEIVLERLQAHGIGIYRTDQRGTIVINTDGNHYALEFPAQNENN